MGAATGQKQDLESPGLYEVLRTTINERAHCTLCMGEAVTWLLADYIASCPNEVQGDEILKKVLNDLPGLVESSRRYQATNDGVGRPVGRA